MLYYSIIFLTSAIFWVKCNEKNNERHFFNEETSYVIQNALSSLPAEKVPNEFKFEIGKSDKLFSI